LEITSRINQTLHFKLEYGAHIKFEDYKSLAAGRIAPPACALLAVMALGVYDSMKARKKKQQELGEDATEIKPEVSVSQKKEVLKVYGNTKAARVMLGVGKYVGVALLGGLAGLLLKREILHRMEFRADKFAVEMMGGDPEPLTQALTVLNEKMQEALQCELQQKNLLYKWAIQINEAIAHPSLSDRIAKL